MKIDDKNLEFERVAANISAVPPRMKKVKDKGGGEMPPGRFQRGEI